MMEPQNCTVLYKILTPTEKQSLPTQGWYGTEMDIKDGFIHLSTSEQVPWVLNKFFSIESNVGNDLYLLVLPRSHIKEGTLRFDAVDKTVFGHIYGTIDPARHFIDTIHVQRDPKAGTFILGDLQF